jgi:WD40 repeat protein
VRDGVNALTIDPRVEGNATRVLFSPGDRRIVSGHFGFVMVHDARDGQLLRRIRPSDKVGEIRDLAISYDGGRIVTTSQFLNFAELWDATTGRRIATFLGHTRPVTSVAFSPDVEARHIATASEDGTVRLWNVQDGRLVRTLHGHVGGVFGVVYHPRGDRLASIGSDGTVRIWDVASDQELRKLTGVEQEHANDDKPGWNTHGNILTFSRDGGRLAAASDDGRVVVWNTETGQEAFTLHGHNRWVSAVAFSPNGRRIATAGQDETIKLWDALTGEEVFTLRVPGDAARSIAFSHDGARLDSAGSSGVLKVFDATPLP